MNRATSTFSPALAAIVLTFASMGSALAQSAPQIDRLTSLQRQRFARDLAPSGAQDFFNAGQVIFEQEVRLLTRPRSPLNEPLLKVSQGSQTQPNEHVEQPVSLPRDRAK